MADRTRADSKAEGLRGVAETHWNPGEEQGRQGGMRGGIPTRIPTRVTYSKQEKIKRGSASLFIFPTQRQFHVLYISKRNILKLNENVYN